MKFFFIINILCTLSAGATNTVSNNNFSKNTREIIKDDGLEKTIKGKITDVSGEPIPGVNIYSKKNPLNGTISDFDGNYSIRLNKGDTEVVFTYIGYKEQIVKISNNLVINVTLKEDVTGLNEVVVRGFGTQKKVNITGSVASVTSEKIEDRPVQNVTQALQGLVAGMNFGTSGGGALNNKMQINIRGTGTIGGGSNSSPLVLIDGMEGDMNSLNPQDIESISVLKDASASSIYGSRAAFGVILITTKKGKIGSMKVSYNTNFRWSDPLLLPKMMNSLDFANYWNEGLKNSGSNPMFDQETIDRIIQYQKGEITDQTIAKDNGRWALWDKPNANTDWFKEHYKSWAPSQEHAINMTGGSEKVQYYLSTNYLGQDGLLTHAQDSYKRFTLTANVTAKLADKLTIKYGSKFIRENYKTASAHNSLFFHNIARRWPVNPTKDPNGNYAEGSQIQELENGGRKSDEKDQLYNQFRLDFEPIKGFKIISELNYRTDTYFNSRYELPVYAYDTDNKPYPIASGYASPGSSMASEFSAKNTYFNPNIYSEWSQNINDHSFTLLTGFQSESNNYRKFGGYRKDLITSELPTINTATGDDIITSGGKNAWSTAGFFGRLNYNYKEKYLIELNARYDGTSRFLQEKRWNLFPSVSGGWNLSKESFWKPIKNTVNTFKLRASWGELGNQNTKKLYPFYVTMPIGVNNGGWLIDGKKTNTANSPGLVSSSLTWETVRSWNVGLDAGVFDNRLTVVFDYFNRITKNMVGPAPSLPVTLGTDVPKINNADMKSWGFELELAWRDNIGDFSYGIRGLLADDQQKVTRYPNETGNLDTWYSGKMNNEIWGYSTQGIAKTDQEMNDWLKKNNQNSLGDNWAAGDIMYQDINGDEEINSGANTLDDHGDLKIIGNSTPRFKYSIDIDMAFKGFDFRMLWQGVGKRDYALGGPYFWGANSNMWQAAAFESHLDYFRPEGHELGANLDAYYPRPLMDRGGKNTRTQTRYLQNAAYLRLKNIQLGYTISKNITKRVGISKLRLYVSGENLLTFTKMSKMFDPETISGGWSDGKIYPLSKTISIGANITF
ncbi:TonB-dependent receptor [Halosquirtibacter laminarini]|uniref:TonB-dependent receptor n=1 Tax=Halosquirtibacter laminarini TaxID=3374600 RepID=A0AC61NEJ4_9BACT|nr:TonB-dependent receptor [Prolixibacteraceae bacterium]